MADTRDYYQETVKRLEPDIAPIDASAFYASAAISLKRIADALEVVIAAGLTALALGAQAEKTGREFTAAEFESAFEAVVQVRGLLKP